jgi:signal transduction histidine kinase
MDSVFLHDMKNLEFRLNLLLSNLEEHYGDPDFKSSVVDLLQSTLEKVDSVMGRWSEHKESVLIKVALDLNDVLRQVTAEARPRESILQANPEGWRAIETSLATIPAMWGDPHYLKDAFLSIVQNALEAAGPAGHVFVGTRKSANRGAAAIEVEVRDDGPGMPRDFIRKKLFHPFQTTKADGVGLGLYTAREILRFHGGEIRVESVPEAGTAIHVRLPAAT